jgi:hypothetical protein
VQKMGSEVNWLTFSIASSGKLRIALPKVNAEFSRTFLTSETQSVKV